MEKLTNKQVILIILALCILFIILTNVLKNMGNKDNNINYEEASGQSLINSSVLMYDRDTYWTLNEIIIKVLGNYQDEKYKDYYEILEKSYKKQFNKSKFNILINKFYDKFKVYPENDDIYIDTDKVLVDVYEYIYAKNMYICKLKNNSYLGIQLNNTEKKFNIFYIE